MAPSVARVHWLAACIFCGLPAPRQLSCCLIWRTCTWQVGGAMLSGMREAVRALAMLHGDDAEAAAAAETDAGVARQRVRVPGPSPAPGPLQSV